MIVYFLCARSFGACKTNKHGGNGQLQTAERGKDTIVLQEGRFVVYAKDAGNDHEILSPCGEIDCYTSPILREVAVKALGEGKRIILDLSEVEYYDAAAIGTFMHIRNRQDKVLHLVIPTRNRKLLELTKLTQVFSLHDELEEAVIAALS